MSHIPMIRTIQTILAILLAGAAFFPLIARRRWYSAEESAIRAAQSEVNRYARANTIIRHRLQRGVVD
jgi:hypothetical protein